MTRRGRIRLAACLWIVLAVVVWNVIFDRVLVLAGRSYASRAAIAVTNRTGYVAINEVMPEAIRHGARVASVWAGLLAASGLVLVAVAARRTRE